MVLLACTRSVRERLTFCDLGFLPFSADPRTGHPEAFFEEIVICCRFQNRSLQPQAESGSCVVLSGHLAAMVGPPGRPGGVVVGYPPRTPAQARVCAAPGDVPAPCPRGPRGYRSMVRVAIGSAIHHFSPFRSRPVPLGTVSPAYLPCRKALTACCVPVSTVTMPADG